MDDDDAFLYGDETPAAPAAPTAPVASDAPSIRLEQPQQDASLAPDHAEQEGSSEDSDESVRCAAYSGH